MLLAFIGRPFACRLRWRSGLRNTQIVEVIFCKWRHHGFNPSSALFSLLARVPEHGVDKGLRWPRNGRSAGWYGATDRSTGPTES
jgi:hypothetical protein